MKDQGGPRAGAILFDAHLDLAMNALEWNRDLTRPIEEIRLREADLKDKAGRGQATVCLPAMRRARMGLCVASLIARCVRPGNPLPGWHSPELAWAQTQGQRAWYRAMEESGELSLITNPRELERHLDLWQENEVAGERPDSKAGAPRGARRLPVGVVLSLEGADSVLTVRHLSRFFEEGLRAVGLSHYGPGTYAAGTDGAGGLTERGRELLKEIARLGLILDVTHLTDDGFTEVMERFEGFLWASHSNCRALVPRQRQLSDQQIRSLVDRQGVIGIALDAWMLVPAWVRGQTTSRQAGLRLDRVADHIDHVCQIAGNADHVGIGSDLDGGFGRERTPMDIETIADLSRLEGILGDRGYPPEAVDNIMAGNFIRFLRRAWDRPGWPQPTGRGEGTGPLK